MKSMNVVWKLWEQKQHIFIVKNNFTVIQNECNIYLHQIIFFCTSWNLQNELHTKRFTEEKRNIHFIYLFSNSLPDFEVGVMVEMLAPLSQLFNNDSACVCENERKRKMYCWPLRCLTYWTHRTVSSIRTHRREEQEKKNYTKTA